MWDGAAPNTAPDVPLDDATPDTHLGGSFSDQYLLEMRDVLQVK